MAISKERIEEIIETLAGTCTYIGDVCSIEEMADKDLWASIDDAIFECDRCGWWCEISGQSDMDGEMICEDCNDE